MSKSNMFGDNAYAMAQNDFFHAAGGADRFYQIDSCSFANEIDFSGAQLSMQGYQNMQKMYAPPKTAVCEILKMCAANPLLAVNHILKMGPEEFSSIARDAVGSKFLQTQLSENPELRIKIFEVVLRNDLLFNFATDNFANFVVQKMLTDVHHVPFYSAVLFDAIEFNLEKFSFHRYACRVVQKYVDVAPAKRTIRMLKQYEGLEAKVTKDQNANHIVQRVLSKYLPSVYTPFFKAMIGSNDVSESYRRIKAIIEDKYGCRVIQMCLERVVSFLESAGADVENKSSAFELLHVLIGPILRGSKDFSENEFANYIIQFIIRSPFMAAQRDFVIQKCILRNILWLSQGKYASHVVEQALVHANPVLRKAMVEEILDGYYPDDRGRDALDIMLFDQFANYVIQRLLMIAIEEYRRGFPHWYKIIACRARKNYINLQRYSSGKKILESILEHDQTSFLSCNNN